MKLYYMRDNHTFKPLSLDINIALFELAEEFIGGYKHGLLCASGYGPTLNACGDWAAFKEAAIKYIEEFKVLSGRLEVIEK